MNGKFDNFTQSTQGWYKPVTLLTTKQKLHFHTYIISLCGGRTADLAAGKQEPVTGAICLICLRKMGARP